MQIMHVLSPPMLDSGTCGRPVSKLALESDTTASGVDEAALPMDELSSGTCGTRGGAGRLGIEAGAGSLYAGSLYICGHGEGRVVVEAAEVATESVVTEVFTRSHACWAAIVLVGRC